MGSDLNPTFTVRKTTFTNDCIVIIVVRPIFGPGPNSHQTKCVELQFKLFMSVWPEVPGNVLCGMPIARLSCVSV